jgi:CubicO group peptidase (beta-lactamase class C family)
MDVGLRCYVFMDCSIFLNNFSFKSYFMIKKRFIVGLFLIILVSINATHAQVQPLKSSQIDSLVSKSMSMMPLAGMAVAVVKDGKIIHAKGYGVTSIKTKEAVNENTLFAIASNSKAFTSMSLAMLADEGKLKWSDKVVDFIPEFKMYDPYVTANFTIEDLLTHRSGMGLGAGDLMFFPDGSNFTMQDILKSFQYQKPTSDFRTKFDYDNLLYMVAGEVVARVSGMPWTTFVETKIMKPLGMNRSAAMFQDLKDKKNVAMPHSADQELKQIEQYAETNSSFAAAGGIYASVNDLSQWMLLHLNGGKYGDGLKAKLVSAENHHEMLRPHTFIGFNGKPNPAMRSHFNAYGLGWGVNDLNGYAIFSHTGGLPGMLSKTTLVPELNLGVIVLTNTDPGGFAFETISRMIVNSYLNIKMDVLTMAAARVKERQTKGDSVTTAVWNIVKNAKATNLNFANFTGTYRDNWFGEVNIDLKDGQLWFTSKRSPKLHGKMSFYKANTFAIAWDYQDMECDAFATFSLDEEGKAVGIKMKGISPNIDFSFDFQDLDLKRVK